MVQETRFVAANLIWPIFVIEGTNRREPIHSMPGVERLTVDLAALAAEEAANLGIGAIAIFPVTPQEKKTEDGRHACDSKNLICETTRAIAAKTGNRIGIVCDVALDPYTSHGQDGLLRDGYVVNDETIAVLCEQAVNQAKAGATLIAPSDMMDGRIGAIRDALDESDPRSRIGHLGGCRYCDGKARYALPGYRSKITRFLPCSSGCLSSVRRVRHAEVCFSSKCLE